MPSTPDPIRKPWRRTGVPFHVVPACAAAPWPTPRPVTVRTRLERFQRALPLLASCLLLGACAGLRSTEPDERQGSPVDSTTAVTPSGIAPPPAIRTVEHVETMHGVVVADPYRWLEEEKSAEVRAWVSAQETFAAQVLARTITRGALAARYERALREAPTLDLVLDTPRGLVLSRWLGDSPSCFVASHDASGEKSLAGVAALVAAHPGTRVRAEVPSTEGRLLALGTTAAGDEGAQIVVVDTGSGELLPDRIPDLLTTTSGTRYQVSWLPSGAGADASFIYPRLWPGSDDGTATERFSRGRQFVHRIGTPQSDDVAVFGYGVSPAVPMAPEDLATRVHAAPGSRWLLASVFRARRNGSDHYAARRTPGDATVPDWRPLLGVDDRASGLRLYGDSAYALLRRDADRGRIARRVLGEGPEPDGPWETVVAERRGVITDFAVQPDGLYFTERDGGTITLYAMAHGATAPRPVILPMSGTVRIARRASNMPGVLVSVQSWTVPPRWFRVTHTGTTVARLAIDGGSASAPPETLVHARIEAPSRDGTRVPVSIAYDRAALPSVQPAPGTPLLVETYGAFGQAADPEYNPYVQVWTSLGGVYAYAHVRGGGELGDAWHRATTRANKQRSVVDVIGAVEELVRRGISSPGRVAFQGISFGGVIGGLLSLQRPDLFGAVLYDVGAPDEVRAGALDPTAARNMAEIGDLDSAQGVQSLLAASPYHRTPQQIALPALLIHSATDDYNFGTQMLVGKWVARLQAANTGTRPVVWVRTTGGHRWLWSISPEWAATFASFMFWQLGDPRYQPPVSEALPADRSAR